MQIPLEHALPTTYRIERFECSASSPVCSMTVRVPWQPQPGQFVMVWVPGIEEIPLSISDADGDSVQITFFPVGDATKALAQKKVGDLVGLRGPFGTHYTWKPGQRIVLVAGGYGAAPMYFAAKRVVESGATIDVLNGARTKDDLLFLSELTALHPRSLQLATEDGSEGEKGYNTHLLEALIAADGAGSIDWIFSCGPEPMLKRVSEIAAAHGIPAQLSVNRYMKCGYGLCGNCTIDPLGVRMCVEGPVITNDLALQLSEFGAYRRTPYGQIEPFTKK